MIRHMTAADVLEIYNSLKAEDITIWVDGGWCVDALLGEQTREHPDLDVAVNRKDVTKLKELLVSWGYKDEPRNDTTEWNYAMVDSKNRLVDIHVFEFDERGNNTYGIEYPKDSLTSTGTINGQTVNCIAPEWMFKFKTAYEPKEKDLKDVHALATKFGFEVPESHQ